MYLSLGLRVIALTGKAPNGLVHRHGLKDAIHANYAETLPQLYEWVDAAFMHPRTTGVGILTGAPYHVVDIDGEEGAAAWRELVGEGAFMPSRWVARTGRGLHLWYADERPWPTTVLGHKLDFKGRGGYVAAPPSRHPDGHRYEWLIDPDQGPPWEFPDGLMARLERNARERAAMDVNRTVARGLSRKPFVDGMLYPVATFQGVLDAVRQAPEGRRNNMLLWGAATLAEEGADDEDFEELGSVAEEAGLTRQETRRTIRSGRNLRKGS